MRDWEEKEEEEEEESAEGEFWEDRGAAGLDLLLSTVNAASIYLFWKVSTLYSDRKLVLMGWCGVDLHALRVAKAKVIIYDFGRMILPTRYERTSDNGGC
jgi:hypothetical protein